MSELMRTKDQSDARRKDTSWGSLTWLASDEIGNCPSMTVGRVVIRAGHSNPAHAHDNCDEVLYLLAGRLEHAVDERTVTMNPGDTLVVPAGCMHHARSTGEVDADMIVTYSAGRREFREA